MKNIVKIYGEYYNLDHYKNICASSKMGEYGDNVGKCFPCVCLYLLDGTLNRCTDYSSPFDYDEAAKKSAELYLSTLLDK